MADILIRGMEMPENCCYCAFVSYDNDHCTAKDKDIPIYGTIPSWCPLVPLPEKHGRLIDADALLESMRESYQKAQEWRDNSSGEIYDRADATVMAFLEFGNRTKNAPTIVPAEGWTDECSEN